MGSLRGAKQIHRIFVAPGVTAVVAKQIFAGIKINPNPQCSLTIAKQGFYGMLRVKICHNDKQIAKSHPNTPEA